MGPSHLFVDLDGTLTDSREGIARSIIHALAAMNRPSPPPESLARFIVGKAVLIRQALDNGRLDPARVVLVGDRGEDVSGARANGVAAIGVTWGFGSRDELRDADCVMSTPAELVAWARSM